MNKYIFLLAIFLLPVSASGQNIKRDSLLIFDWKFHKGNVENASNPDFNDKEWRLLDLPHDWSMEDLETADATGDRIISGPFDSKAAGSNNSGYTTGGTAWYRKHFTLPASDTGKVVYINFDGVYMNADFWINGHHLGTQPYGYTAVWFDLSKHLFFGDKENIIAVQVKNEGVNSRWYSGSGIYRQVWLNITNRIHIAPWGIYVTTPQVDSRQANINVRTTISNFAETNEVIEFQVDITNQESKPVASKRVSTLINNQVSSDIKMDFQISDPDVWSTDNPKLYKAICTISAKGNILDISETTFGIRSLKFDSEKGFFLNGKSMKLKGGALHANNGPLGAATFERAEERRVELMKKAGFNAVRCGHNPPSSAFLSACDRLGLMVIDETFDVWTIGWLPDDYHVFFNDWWKHDVKNMLLRDRNHPSIIAWSIGNQLRENSDSTGISLAYEMSGFVRSIDNTRPVTANLIVPQMKRNAPPELWYRCDPFFAALDICGYSYQTGNYLTDHERLPDRIMYSAEIDPRNSFDNWMKTIDNEFIIGNFEWTAMDFMGEVGLGWFGIQTPPSTFPWNSTYSGDLDLCGFKRPRSYYRDILFGIGRKVSVFVKSPVPSFEGSGNSRWGWDDVKPSWTWPGFEKQQLQVDVYSSCDSVELSLNGKTLGTKPTSRETEFKASWQVPYQKGTLKAIGYDDNKISETSELQTAGRPYRIRLTPDREIIKSDRQDLCFIAVEILDKNNIPVPYSDNTINFRVNGPGVIAAVGNGNPVSLESYQQPFRKAYEGKCLLIIKSKDSAGQIEATASGKGLLADKIIIKTTN